MSFVVKKSDTKRIVNGWPVTISTAIEGGNVRKDKVFVDYQVLPQSEIDAIVDEAVNARQNADSAILRETVKGISGLLDESNSPIAFSNDTLDILLEHANVRSALSGEFFNLINGRATRKN